MKSFTKKEIEGRAASNLDWASHVSGEVYKLFEYMSQYDWFKYIYNAWYSSKTIEFYIDNCVFDFCLNFHSEDADVPDERFKGNYVLWNRTECEIPMSTIDAILVSSDISEVSSIIAEYALRFNDISKYNKINRELLDLTESIFNSNDNKIEYLENLKKQLDKIIINNGFEKLYKELVINIYRKLAKKVNKKIEFEISDMDSLDIRKYTEFSYLCYEKCLEIDYDNFRIKKEYIGQLTTGIYPNFKKGIEILQNLKDQEYLSIYELDELAILKQMKDLNVLYYLPIDKSIISDLQEYGNITNIEGLDNIDQLKKINVILNEENPQLFIVSSSVFKIKDNWNLYDIENFEKIVLSEKFRNIVKFIYFEKNDLYFDNDSKIYKSKNEYRTNMINKGFDLVICQNIQKSSYIDIIYTQLSRKI